MVNIIEGILQIKEPFTIKDVYKKFPNISHDRLQEIIDELCKTGKIFFWDKYMVTDYLKDQS